MMRGIAGLRLPPCGKPYEAHGPHRFARWSSDTELAACDGWGRVEADASVMARDVLLAVGRNEAEHPLDRPPPPLRLEVHPAARYALSRIIDPAATIGDPHQPRAAMTAIFGVPVIETSGMPPGGWQVIRPGPALASGTVST